MSPLRLYLFYLLQNVPILVLIPQCPQAVREAWNSAHWHLYIENRGGGGAQ